MDKKTFNCLIKGLDDFTDLQKATFGGFGEPLIHPGLPDMIKRIKKHVARAELITNGVLLSSKVADAVAGAGLDVLWVSLDGATPDGYEDIRQGAVMKTVIDNIAAARDIFQKNHVHLGIVFVAMRRNIRQLPDVIRLGRSLGADRFLVTNVMPYTWEMCDEMLYPDLLMVKNTLKTKTSGPSIAYTRMDISKIPLSELYRLTRGWSGVDYLKTGSESMENNCPFINGGSVSVCYDGSISPCLPLMHDYKTFLNDQKRSVMRCVFGNINEQSLKQLWNCSEYSGLRSRVRDFDFSPCTRCGGCRFAASNEEDCLGNIFPACGGCLWAQGIIRCP
jgi:MoaA/NifB/PqqE/SkfB family radical SAM enzyme